MDIYRLVEGEFNVGNLVLDVVQGLSVSLTHLYFMFVDVSIACIDIDTSKQILHIIHSHCTCVMYCIKKLRCTFLLLLAG